MLDRDHFDLEKVKDRIVEHLAVAKLRNEISGQILCFVGPPGVGKTSLGQSIAKALGRKFVRMSVGGVRDEAEIRGHRRTYIGAMPGTIIRSLRDAESRNPVILIDEIDKMGADFRGDPSSAMLEVLDPEQNKTFRDHYLDLPFDLSKVLFICTANTLDTIPGPLLDRMDTISLSGYTDVEKLAIAKRYLLPKQLEAAGLKRSQLTMSDTQLRTVIREYTREAGVRSLERRLADICRKAATQVAKGKAQKMRVDDKRLREWLGPRRFSGEVRRRTSQAGVATGLAYTTAGGDVLFIEAAAYPGKGELIITGQLGDVMKESAKAALSWVRSHTSELGVEDKWFEEHDLHIHVPAGAVPKDGPSAGVTIATAIASLVRGERDRRRRRDDGRDHAHRTGAADRRHPREVARRAAGRPEADHPAAREHGRPERAPARDPRGADVHPGRHGRGRVRRGVRRQAAGALVARALGRRQAGRAVERLTRAALLAAIALLFPAHAAAHGGALCHAEGEPCVHRPRRGGALVSNTISGARSSCTRRTGRPMPGASRHLAPLLYARTSGGRPLTRSGVYYLPFSEPGGPQGAGSVELHVADGSEIRSDRVDGPGVAISAGGAPFGSCLARLATPRLAGGWLPILELRYGGYRQESFAARAAGTLVSFVHVTGRGRDRADADRGRACAARVTAWCAADAPTSPSTAAARWDGRSLTFRSGDVYAAWLGHPAATAPQIDAAAYASARASVGAYWRDRLSERRAARGAGDARHECRARADRPEPRAVVALQHRQSLRGVLVPREPRRGAGAGRARVLRREQNDAAGGVHAQADGRTRAGRWARSCSPRPSTPAVGRPAASSRGRRRPSPDTSQRSGAARKARGLLAPEHFSSDIPDAVQGLHAQAVAWQGLLAIAAVWARQRPAGVRGRRPDGSPARLGAALRRAVASSSRRLPDGSLFLPMRLGAGEQPYDTVTESREGSYWNLVAPYALASGLFPPGSRAATGALAYLERHGSLLLGLVRAGGYSLYGPGASPRLSGTDEVYGVNLARFLAAQDDADELVLALYGQLAAAMTPNTFVAGEAASVAPLDGLRYRAMYLPPNSVANDAFLETLRLMLVQETATGLRLAFATPRAWLRPGRRIAVSGVPTAFGPVSYSLDGLHPRGGGARRDPGSGRARTIRLRLRLPAGKRIRRALRALPLRPGHEHDRAPVAGGFARFRGADLVESLRWGGGGRSRPLVCGALALAVAASGSAGAVSSVVVGKVRVWKVAYRAHDGARRYAYVALPRSYRPGHAPPIPLVISPHGRGVSGRANVKLWGQLPAIGELRGDQPRRPGPRARELLLGLGRPDLRPRAHAAGSST